MSPWGPWDTKTQIFLAKDAPTIWENTFGQKNLKFFCAFRGDSGIVKETKSGLTHPRVILGWQNFFWDILFFCKICVQNFVKIHAVILEIFTCLLLTDRQTDSRTNEYHIRVGGRDFSTVWKNYLPYSLRKFRFAHLLRSQGDEAVCFYKLATKSA
jgi:hypothetical protein